MKKITKKYRCPRCFQAVHWYGSTKPYCIKCKRFIPTKISKWLLAFFKGR